jgi:hypothetical protein
MSQTLKNNNSKPWSFSRTAKVIVCLLLMLGLLAYGKLFNPAVTLEMCLEDPERFDGKLIGVGMEATVVELLSEGFIIREMGKTIKVIGTAEDIKPGDYITISAVFHKEGWLDLKASYVATYRRLKMVVSLFPALLIIASFFIKYRFDFVQFEFCERKSCRT